MYVGSVGLGVGERNSTRLCQMFAILYMINAKKLTQDKTQQCQSFLCAAKHFRNFRSVVLAMQAFLVDQSNKKMLLALLALVGAVFILRQALATKKFGDIFEYILTHHRGALSFFFILPASVIWDALYYLRNRIIFYMGSAPKDHEKRVKQIQQEVKNWIAAGKPSKMVTARPSWQNMTPVQATYKSKSTTINTNLLMDVLEVDVTKRTVRCEPMVNMGQLTATLLPLGWTIPVVPELDELTVGGLIMGFGVETSSHKYGLFQNICVAFELVMANGEVVTCDKDNNPELFYSVPWSYGALGFLVSAVLQIVPAKKYVKIDYHPFHDQNQMLEYFAKESNAKKADFVECLAYSDSESVVMIGNMTDDVEESKINPLGNYYKEWFFTHVQKYLSKGFVEKNGKVEYVPLRHYYHRHSRSLFWTISEVIPFGNHPVFRALFGWAVPPKISMIKLTETKTTRRLREEKLVVQDLLVPISKLGAALDMNKKETNFYPLWLCPMLVPKTPHRGMINPTKSGEEMFVDVGIYGPSKVPNSDNAPQITHNMEVFCLENEGFQALYSDCYMSEDEFRTMFDHSLHDKLRTKYGCEEAFPSIFFKIGKKHRTAE